MVDQVLEYGPGEMDMGRTKAKLHGAGVLAAAHIVAQRVDCWASMKGKLLEKLHESCVNCPIRWAQKRHGRRISTTVMRT